MKDKALLVIVLIAVTGLFAIFKSYEASLNSKEIPAVDRPAPESQAEKKSNGEIKNIEVYMPSKEKLIPKNTEFFVNRIFVPESTAYPFIPVKEDSIRTFSGSFGSYEKDPRQYVHVELCSFPYRINSDVKFCERVDLSFLNGKLFFVRGYAPNEFIAAQALRDFGAHFVVKCQKFSTSSSKIKNF